MNLNFLCKIGIHKYEQLYKKRSKKEQAGFGSIFGNIVYLGKHKCNRCGKTIEPDGMWDNNYD